MFNSKHPTLKGIRLEISVKLTDKYSLLMVASYTSFIYLPNLKLTDSLSQVLLFAYEIKQNKADGQGLGHQSY